MVESGTVEAISIARRRGLVGRVWEYPMDRFRPLLRQRDRLRDTSARDAVTIAHVRRRVLTPIRNSRMMTRFSVPRDSARYNQTTVFEGKPIIGVTGGIGSGKTFVAKMFGEAGCLVINSDEMVRHVYHDETVKHT